VPINNSAPTEIVAGPFELYWAELEVAFPLIDAVPDPDDWKLVGLAGSLNRDESGVTIGHNKSINKWRADGDTGVRKTFLNEQDQTVRLIVVDMSLEAYRLAMNHNTITTVPAGGEAGYKKLGLSRGTAIKTFQLLLRGPSPEMIDGAMQYEIPYVQETGNPELVFRKGVPAGLALEFTTLIDPAASSVDERYGRVIVQTDAAVS
jgi:hypothetical protein